MRQIILLIGIFTLGAVSYPFLHSLLSSLVPTSTPVDTIPSTNPSITHTPEIAPVKPAQDTPETQKVVIDEQGGLHDGPFTLRDNTGKVVAGTVEIIRSPEETLLQFKNTNLIHNDDTHVYLATDKLATKYIDLGPAKLNDAVFIYGIPFDGSMSSYAYILLYNTRTNTLEYFAGIQ